MGLVDRLRALLGGSRRDAADSAGSEMISCEEAISVLYEYLDGELDAAPSERVRAHFDACARCYPHLRMEESFRSAVRRASGTKSVPPGLRERLLDLLPRTTEGP